MNQELIDFVWSILPKEFKDEVKREYKQPTKTEYEQGYDNALRNYFGYHNLTSDEDANTEPTEFAHEDNFASKEPKSVDMEEKELNLCEMLKGHEGEEFYSRCFGKVTLLLASKLTFNSIEDERTIQYYINGKYSELGEPDLYPSREAYLKYPLDARAAWMEWEQANKPKYEMQGGFSVFLNGKPEADFDMPTLTFESSDLAQQAAEAVKKCIEEFHSKHNQ